MVGAASATRVPSAPQGCADSVALISGPRQRAIRESHSKYSVITGGLVRVKANAGESCGLESRLVTSVSVASSTGPVGCALGRYCPFAQQNAIFIYSTGDATPSTLLDTSSGRNPPGPAPSISSPHRGPWPVWPPGHTHRKFIPGVSGKSFGKGAAGMGCSRTILGKLTMALSTRSH